MTLNRLFSVYLIAMACETKGFAGDDTVYLNGQVAGYKSTSGALFLNNRNTGYISSSGGVYINNRNTGFASGGTLYLENKYAGWLENNSEK